MAGKRKPPTLRGKQGCFIADIYRPDGTRTTISFGPVGERTEGEIHSAFGNWLDLFNQHPHKVLGFESPYEAIDKMINPAAIVSVGDLLDKYVEWAQGYLASMRDGRSDPDLIRVTGLARFTEPYHEWPVGDFGPDELKAVQSRMVSHRYSRANHEKEPIPYARSSINQVINQIYRVWQWAILARRIEDPDSKAAVFSPGEAVSEMGARRLAQRKTPMSQGKGGAAA